MPFHDDFLGLDNARRRMQYVWAAVALLVVATALLALPATAVTARKWFLYENGPVELVTFFCFLGGSIASFALAARSLKLRLGLFTAAFYAAFAVGLFFVAGEEISWGQWLFHWATPQNWGAVNVQHETNLHNLKGVADLVVGMHVLFSLGALIGIALARVAFFRNVATPAVLRPWFVLTLLHTTGELVTATTMRGTLPHKVFDYTSEIAEMYIAMGAFAYVLLNARRIRAEAGDCPASAAGVQASPLSRPSP